MNASGIINRHVALLNSNIRNIPIVKCFQTVCGYVGVPECDAVVLSSLRVLAATIKIQSLMQSNFLLSDQQDFRFPRCCNLIVAKHFQWRCEWNCMSHIYFSLAQTRNIKLNVSPRERLQSCRL